jgi:plastocyanin
MSNRSLGLAGLILTFGGVVLIAAGSLLVPNSAAASYAPGGYGGMMGGGYGGMMGGGYGGMMGGGYGGMMGGGYGGMMGGSSWDAGTTSPGPGESGFVAGTPAAPRAVRILATPELRFVPNVVRVQAGETIRFDVTTVGPVAHDFMVGPAADVAADADGTPEVADITMMETASLTYTFSGSGPFAFACHVPGHHEAGMAGTIEIVG